MLRIIHQAPRFARVGGRQRSHETFWPKKRGRGKKSWSFWNQWVRLSWFYTKNRPLWSFKGQKPIISGFDRKCVGGAKI